MALLNIILFIIAGILSFFLVLPFLTVILSFLGKERLSSKNKTSKNHDFGCIITAYRNAEITKPLIDSLIKQKYPNFHIYLVADNCDITDFNFNHEKLTILNPQPPLNLKAKSLILGIESFVRPHEYIAIFDADNVVPNDFLSEINKYAQNGHRSIQGQRTAKNMDTVYACADATGEFYKNYIERYAPYLIGSSSVISGSGMAVEAELYKAYLNSPEIQQGKEKWKKMLQEDKILQNFLLRRKEKIVYAWNAIIYDEKVVDGEQVETQRSRWLFSYFQNLPNSVALFFKGLVTINFNQLFFGLMTMSPPLFILIFVSGLIGLFSIFVNLNITYLLFGSLFIFFGNILLTLYLSKVPSEIWKALWGLPLFVFNQIKALLKMGNPNKNFKHSEHTRSYTIEELEQKGK